MTLKDGRERMPVLSRRWSMLAVWPIWERLGSSALVHWTQAAPANIKEKTV